MHAILSQLVFFLQVLENAIKTLGVYFHFDDLPRAANPHVRLVFQNPAFSWLHSSNRSESELKNEQEHKKFKRQFDFVMSACFLIRTKRSVRTLHDFVCLCCGLDSFDQ